MMGTRYIRVASLMLLLLGVSWAVHAEVYKWFDADGKVQYGNNPPKGVNAKPISGGVTVVPAMKFKKAGTVSDEEHSSAASDREKEGRNMASGQEVEADKKEASASAGKGQASSKPGKDSTLILPNGQTYKPMPGWSTPPIRPSSSKTAGNSSSSASSASRSESSSK